MGIIRATMNRLANLLPQTHVLAQVDVTSKKRAFEEAGLLFESLHGLSRALVTDSLFSRERLGSTGLGHGVAIPHILQRKLAAGGGGGWLSSTGRWPDRR